MAISLGVALENPVEREKIRKRLLSYPHATEESVDHLMGVYEMRAEHKRDLLEGGHVWNALAESRLERQGWPRPPGWPAVFFYPDSLRPRNWLVFWVVVALALLWAFGFFS
jgi:hypothetical protein